VTCARCCSRSVAGSTPLALSQLATAPRLTPSRAAKSFCESPARRLAVRILAAALMTGPCPCRRSVRQARHVVQARNVPANERWKRLSCRFPGASKIDAHWSGDSFPRFQALDLQGFQTPLRQAPTRFRRSRA
jgi:hypothetical protein